MEVDTHTHAPWAPSNREEKKKRRTYEFVFTQERKMREAISFINQSLHILLLKLIVYLYIIM